eukprot:1348131-Rhodomonas_salina.2
MTDTELARGDTRHYTISSDTEVWPNLLLYLLLCPCSWSCTAAADTAASVSASRLLLHRCHTLFTSSTTTFSQPENRDSVTYTLETTNCTW